MVTWLAPKQLFERAACRLSVFSPMDTQSFWHLSFKGNQRALQKLLSDYSKFLT